MQQTQIGRATHLSAGRLARKLQASQAVVYGGRVLLQSLPAHHRGHNEPTLLQHIYGCVDLLWHHRERLSAGVAVGRSIRYVSVLMVHNSEIKRFNSDFAERATYDNGHQCLPTLHVKE